MKRNIAVLLTFVLVLTSCLTGFGSLVMAADENEPEYQYQTVFSKDFNGADALTGWEASKGTISIDSGALKLDAEGDDARATFPSGFAIKRGATYRVSYRSKTKIGYFMGIESASLKWRFDPDATALRNSIYDNNDLLRGTTNNKTADWETISYTFTLYELTDKAGTTQVENANTDKLFFRIGGKGEFWLDDLKIELQLPPQEPDHSVKTEIVNETFDAEANIANWSPEGAGAALTWDNGALKVANTSTTAQARANYTKLFSIKNGATYTVSYRMKTGNTGWSYFLGIENGNNKWKLNTTEDYTNYLYDNAPAYRGSANNPGTDWETVSYSFTVEGLQNKDGEAVDSFTIGKMFFLFPSASSEYWLDDFKIVQSVPPRMPELTSVTVSGAMMEGSILTAAVLYDDPDGVFDKLEYVWQESSDDKTWSDIANANADSFTIPAGYEGKYIRVGAALYNKTSDTPTETVYSASKKVVAKRTPPSVENVSINEENGEFTAVYTYVKSSDGKAEGTTRFIWQRSETGTDGWTTIAETTTAAYTPVGITGYLRVGVIPADTDGVEGGVIYSPNSVALSDQIVFYVAPDAPADGNGSYKAPFATPEAARDAIRDLKSKGILSGGATVYFRGGEYYRDTTFTLTAEDSGTPDAPITYRAYPGEKVSFTGGKRVPLSKVTGVTDSKITDRVIDPVAKAKLMQIDLNGLVDEIPEIPEYSHLNDANGTAGNLFTSQMQIYVNGQALQCSRWPNDRELVITKSDGKKDAPSTFSYEDSEDRARLWSSDALGDLFAEGHFVYHWTYGTFRAGALDAENKSVTLKNAQGNYGPTTGGSFYFRNLIEEIDIPGESYVDTQKKIVYFYPFVDMSDAEVIIPVAQATLLSVNGASNIIVQGMDFEYVRNRTFELVNCNNVTVDGCGFRHFTRTNAVAGSNNIFRNNDVYDGAAGGIGVSGGDINSLNGGQNLIENNRLDSPNTLKMAYAPALSISGVSQMIKNNEICNSAHELISLSGNNHKILYNEIHHGAQWTGDMGAVYWGRTPLSVGYEISNNYFHNHGTSFASGWAQSIFWDDGAIGPKITNNIFYQGTYATSEGAKGNNFAIKTNGGQYGVVENNIFVDNPFAVQFQDWNPPQWWLALYNKHNTRTFDWWTPLQNTLVNNAAWKNCYADTQWGPYLDSIVPDVYETRMKNLDPKNADDYQKLQAIAKEYVPGVLNSMSDNVIVQSAYTYGGLYGGSSGTEENSYVAVNDQLASGNSMFVDYGKDFQLTDEGLAEVRQKAKNFQNIDTSKIGLQPYTIDDETRIPGGTAPVASDLMISGNIQAGGTATAKYTFSDADGDLEGMSEFKWFLVDSRGKKTSLNRHGRELKIEKEWDCLLYTSHHKALSRWMASL